VADARARSPGPVASTDRSGAWQASWPSWSRQSARRPGDGLLGLVAAVLDAGCLPAIVMFAVAIVRDDAMG
jgi:hypothetical protein